MFSAILTITANQPYTQNQIRSVLLKSKFVHQTNSIRMTTKTRFFGFSRYYVFTCVVIASGSGAQISADVSYLLRVNRFNASVQITTI